MGSVVDDPLRGGARFRCGPGFACVLAFAASAGPAPPRAASSESVLKIEESPASRVLYFEESGGLIAPVAKPVPGSFREPPPPLQARTTNTLKPVAPVARADPPKARKTRLAKVPPTAGKGFAVTFAQGSVAEEGLRLERRIDTSILVTRLASTTKATTERVRGIEDVAGQVVISYRSAQAAAQLGWLWLDEKKPADANLWFQRARAWGDSDEEVTRGLALASLAERNYTDALAIADELPIRSPARTDVSREAWVGIGRREYDAERFGSAIRAFDRAAADGELPRFASMLRAWSRLRVGDQAAATDFARLYRELPDMESAQGIIAATSHGSMSVDATTASTEPLASLVRERAGEAAFKSRRYLEARALDPTRWGSLGSPGVITALVAAGRRERTGEGGLGKLIADLTPGVDISFPVGERAAISLLTDRVQLDAGLRMSSALVGSAPAGRILALTGAPIRAVVRESHLSLRVERDIVLVASAGSGVRGGRVAASPVGSVAISASPTWGQTEVRAFVEPVRESMLSWAGLSDPYSGSVWGGVRRRGIEARVLYLRSAPYSAGLQVRGERLSGTLVANNVHRALNASLGRDLGLSGFAYSSLGLAASIDTYERNLSRYTLGHGGYYSPQSQRKAGVAFDFMTEEAKRWLVRGRMSVARAWKREDTAPFLPLEPDGRLYEGSRSKGYDASIRVSGVTQISPQAQVGWAFSRGVSPQFGDKLVMLELRVLLEPRRGLVSADLPNLRSE